MKIIKNLDFFNNNKEITFGGEMEKINSKNSLLKSLFGALIGIISLQFNNNFHCKVKNNNYLINANLFKNNWTQYNQNVTMEKLILRKKKNYNSKMNNKLKFKINITIILLIIIF